MAPPASHAEAPRETRGYSNTDPARSPRKPPLGDLQPRARFSLAYYLAILGGFFLLQWLFFSGVDAAEIPYSEFRAAVAAGKVAEVVLTQERIYGQLREKGKPSPKESQEHPEHALGMPAAKAPWHLGRVSEWWHGLRGDFERDRLEALAKRLLEAEELDRATVLSLLGERPASAPWSASQPIS